MSGVERIDIERRDGPVQLGAMMRNGSRSEHRYDVVVIGGGQAGLAIGHYLARQDRRFTILEAASKPAAAWRRRWDSLRLFTPVRYSSLPGRPFPGDPDSYPRRDDVVAYLTDYARRFELPVELSSPVRAVRRGDGGYAVELDDRAYDAEQLVIATGPFQVPCVPPIARPLDPGIVQFHSAEYRRPDQVPAGPVLVVGGGNTGFQIAEELARTHEVHLSIGSRQTPLPQRIAGRDLFDYLQALGLMRVTVDSRLGQRLRYRETLIGSSPRAARGRHGIRLRGRTIDARGSQVAFADGSRLSPAAVVWATGFAIDHSFVHVPDFDDAARLMHRRGVTAAPGLYFLGLDVAAHARLRTARLGEGRRRVHRAPHRGARRPAATRRAPGGRPGVGGPSNAVGG